MRQLVASHLSEEDARTIAAAPVAVDLAQLVLEGAAECDVYAAAKEVMRQYEGFDPISEDEAQARMEET